MPSDVLIGSFELKDMCLFVDANVYDETKKIKPGKHKPDDIPYAHVMDKSAKPAKYLALNDTAGFIARFIVMGVDLKDIPEILKSEYGGAVADRAQDVKDVYNLLAPYLDPRSSKRPYQAPKEEHKGNHSGVYELDFRVNWFVTGGFKGPL